ncbi:MAG: type II secretion system protein GspE [Clostridiales bacterium GWF2_38_85]|nr:MAG: type II secretion system protein GspE [Clostridiales bacterium GWF2_38_85]HBL84797.1 type II secretion system protein GspE [Clostridiales bacterium]
MKNIPIGEVLRELGYITEPQLQMALNEQKEDNNKRLGSIFIEKGFITEQQMLVALGQRLNLPLILIETYPVDLNAVIKIPRQLASKYKLIAIGEKETGLVVAANDPLNFYAIEDIRQITNMPVEIVLASRKSIEKAIEYYYSESEAKKAVSKIEVAVASTPVISEPEGSPEEDDDAPVVKLLNSLLLRGYHSNVSDIHIEIFEDTTVVRNRIDGMILDYATLSPTLHPSLIARIKIMANMDIAERRLPQDGHFKVTIEDANINARVSVIPTVYGEKAVIRFLYTNALIDRAGSFGMSEDNYKKLTRILKSPHGIVYLTGPTGSGKTTTLYMILEHLLKKDVNISTIEDPVERNIPRVNQMQVNNVSGLTFGVGLRSLLRQDPDIIMVGETRDNETASISIRAAITGHLVLSTLHTNDAVSTIVRLVDMGIAPYLIASAIVGVVAQRLVRKICPHCGYDYTPDDSEKEMLGINLSRVRKGKGCDYCNHTGYKGRIAIHEIVEIDKNIRKMITQNAPIDKIYEYATIQQGVKTLRDNVLRLVIEGITTTDEMAKIAYSY